MIFTSYVNLTPFDEHPCSVEAVFLCGDPDTGVNDDWDIFVEIDGVDVTYDITKEDRLRLIDEAIQRENALADEAMIDRFEYDRSYDL